MSDLRKDLLDEFKTVIKGKTIDAIIPPFVFLITNNIFGLYPGTIIAIGVSLILGFMRLRKKQSITYAIGGTLAVGIASGFAIYSGNANSFFLPRIITSASLALLAFATILIGRPMAAWASHLFRGWEWDWFKRRDIKPAYIEVTILWGILFLVRMSLQIAVYNKGDLMQSTWVNTLLGFPSTLTVLMISYVYGIWRLKSLKGPGIDEFREGKSPPYRGQTKGF